MQEGTTASVTFPSMTSKDVMTEILARRRSADAGHGHRGGSGRLDRESCPFEGRAGSPPGGAERLLAGAKDHDGSGNCAGAAASRSRSSAGRREGEVHLEDSAALLAEDEEHRGPDSLVVPQGHQQRGLPEALASLLGPDAAGLSATTVTRLKAHWEDEYSDWSKRRLEGKQYVYVWADGIHFNIRLEEDRQCILVLMGATPDGKKELIAIHDGHRESEQSWKELLLDCKARGLTVDPKLATGDGALGFWKAVRQVYPATQEQRCTVHKTANVLDKLPKRLQPAAKAKLHDIWQADTRENANKAFDLFLDTYEAKYPQATECLAKDREVLLAFYDFPAEHWIHLRTTNPIESTFATVRLRHRRTKGNGSRKACLTMVFKLVQAAEKKWRFLNGSQLIPDVIQGVRFINGEREEKAAA